MGAASAEPLASPQAVAEALARHVGGRRWIIATDHAAMLGPFVSWLRDNGAEGVLVVASTRGVGDLPDADIVYASIGRHDSQMAAIRAHSAAIADPAPEVAAAVDRFDPDGSALVVASPFETLQEALGRRVSGARRPAWVALEDKTTVHALWAEAGITTADHMVVPVAEAAAAARELAGPLGTVWAADNTEGWHGGAEYTRWVPRPADVSAAVAWFTGRSRTVRVMPFLNGIPCSIHGFVTATGTAAFRPWEMVIFRRRDPAGFAYAGGASFWDPPRTGREEMRAAARAVGDVLRRRVDYRGPFSIDGVMTADGFRPTELNPRLSAGFSAQAQASELSIGSLVRAYLDEALDLDPVWLEEAIVGPADRRRTSAVRLPLLGADPFEADPVGLRIDGPRAVEAPEQPVATLRAGPVQSGVLLMLQLDPDRVDAGPSVAPLVAAAAVFARDRWDLSVPDLVPAPDLR